MILVERARGGPAESALETFEAIDPNKSAKRDGQENKGRDNPVEKALQKGVSGIVHGLRPTVHVLGEAGSVRFSGGRGVNHRDCALIYQIVGISSDLIRFLSPVTNFAPLKMVVAEIILSAGSLFTSRPNFTESSAISGDVAWT